MNFNRVIIAGNLTKDPISRQAGQHQVCAFGVAVNRTYKDKQEVAFIDCEAWGKQAELIMQYLKKGAPIHVEGRLKSDSWQTQAGEKRQKLLVVVDSFQFLASAHAGAAPRDEHEQEPQRASPALAPDDDQAPF